MTLHMQHSILPLLALCLLLLPSAQAQPLAAGKGKFLGNIYSRTQKVDFTKYWNQVTPENAGKWGSVEPMRDNMVWAELDSAYALAKNNEYPFKLHVLIWGNQQPAWLENLPSAEQREEIEEWFRALAGRYPDMDIIEVVNEPINDPPSKPGNGGGNYLNALGGTGVTGWDWVLEAFRLARQVFPEAKLMLNEYNIVNNNANTSKYLQIINLLKAENLIDHIGVQAHAFSTYGTSVNTIKTNLDALAATGLPLYVTELDIDGPTDEVQLNEYKRVFPLFWEHPAVRGVTLWGFRPGLWRNEQKAYLINTDNKTERPALQWLRTYVATTIVSAREPAPSSEHIRISPNPVTGGRLLVDGIERVQRAELYDLSGRKLLSTIPQNNVISLDTAMSAGLYVLRLYDARYTYARKVVVR